MTQQLLSSLDSKKVFSAIGKSINIGDLSRDYLLGQCLTLIRIKSLQNKWMNECE